MNNNIGIEDIALMPHDDWNNHKQWELYFRKIRPKTSVPFNSLNDMSLRFWEFAEKRAMSIWFPGCGMDYAPKIYSTFSFDVYATDISETAIGFQTKLSKMQPQFAFKDWLQFEKQFPWIAKKHEQKTSYFKKLFQNKNLKSPSFTALKQDFRKEIPCDNLSMIINIRSFQGLEGESMKNAAKNFYNSLSKGGAAIFDTMNVQKKRGELETALLDAGFYIPFHKSEKWYREKLEETGIEFNIIMGKPIAFWGQYPEDKREEYQKRDQAILDELIEEYVKQQSKEQEEVKRITSDVNTTIAHIVYNTG